MTELATLSFEGPIATLTLRRPAQRNALSIDLLRALDARLAEAAARADLRVLVLAGEGKAFCAGMDLKAVLHDPEAPGRLLHTLADVTLRLRALPLVTLAHVQGAAIGGGCGLACVCDLLATHADSVVGYPEVDLGVCPAVVAPWLVRKVGAGRARRILLMGGTMPGTQAHALGMADLLAPDRDALDALVKDTAARLALGGPAAVRATKDLLNHLDGSLDADLVRRGADLSARVVALPETQAVLRARFAASS
ncbi:MAG: enoyl-CoA hydratase/isomerase family protein [Planctomycetota bacterium]|nr:enoyl-CoA hydratase/isomerase family protein [Planctomycetota bacterium]